MKAILLCAGYATRLHPLTLDTPKHLLDIDGKPIVEHVLDKMERIDALDTIYLITNDKFFYSFLEWANEYSAKNPLSKKIAVINDGTDSNENRLGALGDIQFTIEKKHIKDDLLLIAADNLFEFSLEGMHSFFEDIGKTTIALYDVKDKRLARQFGVVEVDETNKLKHFVEKPKDPKSTLISTGIYFLPKKDLPLFRVYLAQGNSADKIGSFFEWIHNKEEVYCYTTQEPWYDIGTLDQLEEARSHFLKKKEPVLL
jgi:glucose-1-phosphate thymidylyltransferase